jgi:hypothetical protein
MVASPVISVFVGMPESAQKEKKKEDEFQQSEHLEISLTIKERCSISGK